MKLLMHICCSNCSIHPMQTLLLEGIDVKGFWFNPNIHPYTEYSFRLESLRRLERLWGLDVEYADEYPLAEFLGAVQDKGADRSAACYGMRLDRTARTAKKMGLDGFTTSLLVSPYQKFDIIQTIGHQAAQRYDTVFYGTDFRPGWNRARSVARELDLYRQRYCGCIYSEMERALHDETRREHAPPA